MKQTYYEILGVGPHATGEIIHAAYRALMLKMKKHPDLGGDPEEAKKIGEAYTVLKDDVSRTRYNAKLEKTPFWKLFQKSAARPDERRRAARTSISATISFCVNHDTMWNSAYVKDYSVTGLRFVSHEPLKAGQSVAISCANTAAEALHGVVRWVRASFPTLFERVYEAGVEFSSPVPDIESRLAV